MIRRPIVEMVNGLERNRSHKNEGGRNAVAAAASTSGAKYFAICTRPRLSSPLLTSPAYPLSSRAMRLWLPRAPLRADEPTSAALALTQSDAPPQ